MKIIKAVREAASHRTPVRLGRMSVTQKVDSIGPSYMGEHLKVTYEATVHFSMEGPRGALTQMRQRAERAIASEVFGELEADLFELKKRLWEESYRGSDDPVLALLNGIIGKVKGETE